MGENTLYTEEQVNNIIYLHDKEFFKLLNKSYKQQKILSVILGSLIGIVMTFCAVFYYTYKTTPPIKSQIVIQENSGEIRDITQQTIREGDK